MMKGPRGVYIQYSSTGQDRADGSKWRGRRRVTVESHAIGRHVDGGRANDSKCEKRLALPGDVSCCTSLAPRYDAGVW